MPPLKWMSKLIFVVLARRRPKASPWGEAGTAKAVTDVGKSRPHTRPFGPPSPRGEGFGVHDKLKFIYVEAGAVSVGVVVLALFILKPCTLPLAEVSVISPPMT